MIWRIGHLGLVLSASALIGTSALAAAESADENLAGAIGQILLHSRAPDFDAKFLDFATLRSFYERRHFIAAWSGNVFADNESKAAIAVLQAADEEGLNPQDYHAQVSLLGAPPTDLFARAERDILLSDGVLRYARDVRNGRAELRALDPDVDLPEKNFDPAPALQDALASGNLSGFFSSLAPAHPEYLRLREALARYRRIAADGGWKDLPETTGVDIDATGASGIALRDRLAREDGSVTPEQTDETLASALKRFQSRHGLDPDGRFGPRTLSALNVAASERVMQIEANMERWRWLPPTLEPVRIMVNVPAGQLELVSNGKVAVASRVIVGRPQAPTPILRAMATSVTVNPPWNVPARIARNEILVRLRKDADYLQTENMILLDGPPGDPYGLTVNWQSMDLFPYHLRQLPGPKNALGRIKLELPNRFDVYLHDTPAKSAFELNERSLSHGCVRVEQILPLASYALSGDAGSMLAGLNDAIASGTTRHFAMKRPLPVYILYSTVFVDADGAVEFRPDIYGRDERLVAALGGFAAGQRVTSAATECRRA